MMKQVAVYALLGAMVMTPAISMAAVAGVTQVGATAKIGGTAPVIRLASSDITQIQSTNRKVTTKTSSSDDSSEALTNIPPQAWLVVTVLFCFVMRSSRRTV